MTKNVVIIGAYGFTGSLIADRLSSREIFPTLAGKNIANLLKMQESSGGMSEILPIDCTEATLLAKLDPFEIIVNCAGPFNLFGNTILEYAISQGKTYFDICGEQAFVYDVFKRYYGEIDNNALVVNSLSFESCLADLMAQEIADTRKKYIDISSFYYFENASFSRGSRYSMQAMKHFPSRIYRDKEFVSTPPLSLSCTNPVSVSGNYSVLFVPYPEVIFFARNFETQNAGTWYIMDTEEAAYSKASAAQPPKDLDILNRKYQDPISYGPAKEERMRQRFRVMVESVEESGKIDTITISGNDTYELTAEIMAEAVSLLLSTENTFVGVHTPSEIFSGSRMLDRLALLCGLTIARDGQ